EAGGAAQVGAAAGAAGPGGAQGRQGRAGSRPEGRRFEIAPGGRGTVTTGHRAHLAMWAIVMGLMGLLAVQYARLTTQCLVGNGFSPRAEESPGVWWEFAVAAGLAFAGALAVLTLARVRSDHAACPHCGKELEPRVSMSGKLTMR